MGLLDCVASPEGRDRFDENERPAQRPQELSRSDHDISRRRGLPLFASQTSLKNIKDVDFWRNRVLRYLFSPEGKDDIRILRVPFNQLGYATVTDFICEIPQELIEPYQSQPSQDEGIFKEYKVFWVKDGIAEPGTFKWEGRIENEYCLGLQLDRKKAVPYGIHDGKGLFYCKPGHRAIVPESEVIPYKKFLRSYLGLPPRKDSLLEIIGQSSVRLSAKAIQAKNSKPGDRVYLPKEKKWATVQWIGKIGNETVVDLVYERPKPGAGQPVSPDEPCISRSMSLADFIGELASEPNTPRTPSSPQENSVPVPTTQTPTPKETRGRTQDQTATKGPQQDHDESFPASSSDDDDEDDDDDDDDSSDETDEESADDTSDADADDYNSDYSEDGKALPRTKEVEDMTKVPDDKIEMVREDPPKIPSPKRKGFFGFSPKNKRSRSLPSVEKEEKMKEKAKSEVELQQQKSPKRSKSPNIFSNFRFKKNPKKQKTSDDVMKASDLKAEDPDVQEKDETPTAEKEREVPKTKPKKKSQWTGLFKSRSKGSLSKISIPDEVEDKKNEEAPQTPVDKMMPPDKIPTPPPVLEDRFNEKQVEPSSEPKPEQKAVENVVMKPIPPGPPKESYEEAQERRRGEVRLDAETDSQSSDSDQSDAGEEEDPTGGGGGEDNPKEVVELETTKVEMHHPPPRSSSDSSDGQGPAPTSPKKAEDVKPAESQNGRGDLPVYLAICPPYIPPEQRKERSPSPPPIPSQPPPAIDDDDEEEPEAILDIKEPVQNEPVTPSPPPVEVKERASLSPAELQDSMSSEAMSVTPEPGPPPVQSSLDRFKEAKVRNRPSSFGSFLARITKNQKRIPGEVLKYPDEGGQSQPPEDLSKLDDDDQHVDLSSPETPRPDSAPPKMESAAEVEKTDPSSPSPPVTIGINRSLVKPKTTVKPVVAATTTTPTPEGDQDGIVLELLDEAPLQEASPPTSTVQQETPTPKPKSRTSFSFGFSKKRKSSQSQQPQTPTATASTPASVTKTESVEELINNENAENIEPSDNESKGKEDKSSKGSTSSFRASFRRTFSLTRKNKRQNSVDMESGEEIAAKTSGIGKPRPVTLYIDNNDVVEPKIKKNSFRNKRPASVVVDIKPWDMRHGTEGVDIYSSPSSEEAPRSPEAFRSPNPALMPKVEVVDIPKHRIFTTPAFFNRNKAKKEVSPIPKGGQKNYKKFNNPEGEETNVKSPTSTSPTRPKTPPPPLPVSPPPPLTVKQRPKSTAFEPPPATPTPEQTKLKSALKQRREIDSIPRGLKIGDRVLWYSGQGPIPGTVQRLFKDGTDKYTAMVKFDREVTEPPLRLIREGDAYIITVEELITPDMFSPKPIYANQEQIGLASPGASSVSPNPLTPFPSVRFNEAESEQDTEDEEELDLPPPFQQEEVQMACGFRRGIQCRDKSCCLESILFSLFYTTNAFDIAMLYRNSTDEDKMTKNVRKILRKKIVDPLRRNGFVSCQAVMDLREAVKPLSEEWQTMSTDAEVMMFILFDRALKLGKFLSYSNDMSDFLHQLVVDPKDLSKSTTIQHLFETSLNLMDKVKLSTVPTPALILEMPRSNDKLMQYKAVIPNLSLHISHLLQDGPRLCICGVVAAYECTQCTITAGRMSIVYCDNCKGTSDIIHFQLPHQSQLSPLSQPTVILDLAAIICVSQKHYISFVKCGIEKHSPWVYFDGAEIENPKVCIEQNLGMWLDRLEKYPGKYQDALQYPLLTHILQDSHICIYQPREKSSSV